MSIHQGAVSGVWYIGGFIGKGTWSPPSVRSRVKYRSQSSQTRSLLWRSSGCRGGERWALTVCHLRTYRRQRMLEERGDFSGRQEVDDDSDNQNDARSGSVQACVQSLTSASVYIAACQWNGLVRTNPFHQKYHTLKAMSFVVEKVYWQRNQM